ncbi:transposase [Streptomyces murinus]|uniref:transposase n=1 Tax=Streptomyces murinus TaxID=33900 RepID=UPI003F45244E
MSLTNAQWARIEPLLPDRTRDRRQVIDAIAFTYRPGTPWTDCPSTSARGSAPTTGCGSGPPTAPGRSSSPPCSPKPTPMATSAGSSRSTLHDRPGSSARRRGSSKGAPPDEPYHHALGRSHGGHHPGPPRRGPLAFVLTPGQAWNAPAFPEAMACSRVPAGGRPRTTPEAVLADKAYSLRALRTHLRRRGIRAVIPQPSERIAKRKKRASPHPAKEYTRRPCLLARRMDGALARSQGAVEQACHTQRYRADLSSSAGSQFRRTTTRSLNCPVAWRR